MTPREAGRVIKGMLDEPTDYFGDPYFREALTMAAKFLKADNNETD